MGSVVIGKLARLSLQKLRLKQGLNEEEALSLYTASSLVSLVEKHALRYPTATPNDPLFLDQWALQKIQAAKAWDINQGIPAIIVAVIDTGVDYSHPDLSDNIWINQTELNGVEGVDDDGNGYVDDVYGWDFAGINDTDLLDEDADPMDVDGHGTHVAGIIAAKGNNSLGISGVCWNIKIMPIKIQADNSDYMEDWDIIRALLYAMDQGARIINCSFGGSAFEQSEYDAFLALRDAGVLAVCASGNDGYNTDLEGRQNYPSSYDLPNILSVGASDQADLLVSYSNYGPISVDLVAPGMNIKSTFHADNYTESSVTIKESAVKYAGIGMTYAGLTGDNGIEATAYSCGLGYAQDFPPEVSGNIALIQRGEIYFSEKVRNAQNARAMAVIIYNNVVDSLDQNGGTLGSPGNWIPAVSISKADGQALIALGNPVLILTNKLVTNPSSYGSREGTSMATPHVTGVAGLILSNFPGLDYVQVKAAILNGVDKVAGLADKIASGGRLNAFYSLCNASGVRGDLSCDGKPSLDDIIIALRVLGDLEPEKCAACPSCGMDVNGDGRIGIEEAIYGLQKMSGE
jgi:subtilisin family serine protease